MVLPDSTPEQEYSSDSNVSLSALEDAVDKVMKKQEELEKKLDNIIKKISSDEEKYVSPKKRRFCLIKKEVDDTPPVKKATSNATCIKNDIK